MPPEAPVIRARQLRESQKSGTIIHIPVDEPVPLEYDGHHVVIFERYIGKGGGDHWGILVNEGEIDDMIRIGLVRAGHKGYKTTP